MRDFNKYVHGGSAFRKVVRFYFIFPEEKIEIYLRFLCEKLKNLKLNFEILTIMFILLHLPFILVF